MADATGYEPPRVWTWNKQNGGRFANINRPIAGPTHDKELPIGRHPLQLYSLGTPNGVKVTIMLEELLANPASNVAADDARLLAVMGQAAALRDRYEAILASKGIDALFMPRSVMPLPDITADALTYLGDQVAGTQVNEMGLPAITVPAGFLDDGRPIAVDIIGRARFTEIEILSLAYDFEQATLLRRSPGGR